MVTGRGEGQNHLLELCPQTSTLPSQSWLCQSGETLGSEYCLKGPSWDATRRRSCFSPFLKWCWHYTSPYLISWGWGRLQAIRGSAYESDIHTVPILSQPPAPQDCVLSSSSWNISLGFGRPYLHSSDSLSVLCSMLFFCHLLGILPLNYSTWRGKRSQYFALCCDNFSDLR